MTFRFSPWGDWGQRVSTVAGRWAAVYNALGQRVQKQFSDTSDNLYDPFGQYIGTHDDPNNDWYAENVPFAGRNLVYFSQSGAGTRFFHVNALGSIGYATRPTGAALEAMLYYPFGSTWQDTTGASWDERFAGMMVADADFQQYMTPNRMFSPALGRWMTPDPAGLGAADPTNPESFNRYAYVMNNPVVNIDPTGLACVWNEKGKSWYDDNSGGESCADAADSDAAEESNPAVTVTGSPGNVQFETVAAIATLDSAQQQNSSEGQPNQQPSSWDKTKPLPDSPDKLGPEWKKNPEYKNPNGEEYVNDKTGEKIEWNKGRPGPWGPKADRGRDDWHYTPPGGVRGKQMDPGTVLKTAAKVGFWGTAGVITIRILQIAGEACAAGACY